MDDKLTFFCNGCNQDRDFDTEYGICIARDKKIIRICRLCRRPSPKTPDVFWDGKPEENLADDPTTGKPMVFFSKSHKASYLKERGLMEAGDRYHGAPIESWKNQNQKTDTRHEVKMALKKVKEMGQDVRRREYLRIKKEGERHVR